VNRAWAELFGRGLVEPVDDLGGEGDPSHPPLLRLLAGEFAAHAYDQAWLFKLLVSTDAYARSSTGGTGDAERVFARAAVRQLSPEQLFRSLLTATDLEEAAARRVAPEKVEAMVERGQREYEFVFQDDEMASVDSFDGNTPQALLLFNGELTNRGSRAAPGTTLDALLQRSKDVAPRVTEMYLVAFARPPAERELARAVAHLRARKDYEDLFFAMLVSTEFTTNH
jgi:hypothetical protein